MCRAKWCCFFLGSCACWAEVSGDLRASPRRPLALATALPAPRRRGGEFCALRRAALSPSPSPPPGEAASSAKVGHVTSTLSLSEPGSRILGPCALARSPAPLAENRHRRYVPRSRFLLCVGLTWAMFIGLYEGTFASAMSVRGLLLLFSVAAASDGVCALGRHLRETWRSLSVGFVQGPPCPPRHRPSGQQGRKKEKKKPPPPLGREFLRV